MPGPLFSTSLMYGSHLELIWQVLGEPWVGLDASNGDPVGWVADKDLAHHVQALPRDVQVGGKAVLHAHDPLHHGSIALRCQSTKKPCRFAGVNHIWKG